MAEFIGLLRDIRDVKYPEIVAKHGEVIERGDALVAQIDESEALMQSAINGAQQVASDKQEIAEMKNVVGNDTMAVTQMKYAIDESAADVALKEKSVNDTYAALLANLTSMNQSITAANVLKHDLETSVLGAADMNAYLMSTITKADNAQHSLSLKVEESKVALDDIVTDNLSIITERITNEANAIDLKIAMAQEARNDLYVIEQSVLIATASADKAQLAYEQAKDTKELIDTVITEGVALTQTLQTLSDEATPKTDALNAASQNADISKIAIDESITVAQSTYEKLQEVIVQAEALGMGALVDAAKAEADRLAVVIPVAQSLSAETEAAVIATQNASQATTIGNALLNLLRDANTAAQGYIDTINTILNQTVEAKVNEVLEAVVSAKIDQIADTGNTLLSQLDAASTEAQVLLDAITASAVDADLSALVV